MKTKMTLILSGDVRETIEVVSDKQGVTDEDVLEQIVASWMHALTCPEELHMMKFRHHPAGEPIIVAPGAVLGFSLKVETFH